MLEKLGWVAITVIFLLGIVWVVMNAGPS